MGITGSLQAAAGYVADTVVGTAGTSWLVAFLVNENRWLRWEVDRLTKLYNADQIHIYDLETMLNPLQADNQKLEAAMSTLQAERDCLMKRLAFNRRATKVSKVSGAKQRASLKQQLSNVQRKLAVAVESNRASAGKLQRLDKFRRELDGNTAALQITNNSLQAISSSLQANLTARTADEVHLDAEVKTLKAISAVLQDATAVKMLQSGKTAVAPQLLVSTGLSNPSEASSKTAVLAEMDAEKAMQPPLQHQATQQVDAAAPDDAVVAPLTSSTAAAQQGSNSEPQDSVDKAPSISSRQNLLLTSEVKSQCPQALQQHMANAALGGHAAVEQRHVVTQQNFPDLRTQHEDVRSQHEQVSSQYKQLSSQHEQLQTSHVAAVQSHQQLAVAQAARVEALTQQHSELQQAHNTNEAELWELADAHAELNSVHDASLVELQETRRQLAMLQKTFRRLTCDRQYVQNQLCSTTAELKAARQEDSAVNLQMQKLQNTEVCLRSQRDGVSAVLDHLAEMHSQCAHKYAEATDRRDKALEHAACLEKHLAGVLHKLETMEQSLAEVMVTPKTASSVKGNLPVADGLIKAVPGKADQLSLGRTDSALDNPSPRRR